MKKREGGEWSGLGERGEGEARTRCSGDSPLDQHSGFTGNYQRYRTLKITRGFRMAIVIVVVIVVHVCFSSLLSPSLFFFISYTSLFSESKNKRKKEKENKSEKRTNSLEELLSRGLDNVLAGVG